MLLVCVFFSSNSEFPGTFLSSVNGKRAIKNNFRFGFHILVSNQLCGSFDVGMSAFISKYAFTMPVEPEIVVTIACVVTLLLTISWQIQCLCARLFRARINASKHLIPFFTWIGAFARSLIVAFVLRNTSSTVVTIVAVLTVAFIFDHTICLCVAFHRIF